jgi:hypothetical protein
MRRIWPFLLAGVLLLRAAGAQTPPPAGGPLTFNVVASVQYAHNEIYFHTPAGVTPVLANTSEIAPGQRLDLLVIVSRYAVDAESRADLSYDLIVHYPDGRTQALAGNSVADKLKVAPPAILFPRAIRAFVTGPRDPFGDYRFEVTVHDRVSGQSSSQSVPIHVAESNRPLPLPDAFEASDWLVRYYMRPEPRLALPALEAMSGNAELMQKGVDALGTILGFYEQVLADNPWLLPWFKQWYVAADEGSERHLLGLVLAAAARADPGVTADLPSRIRLSLAAAGKELPPPPTAEPEKGAQLDVLWGRFYASGRFRPVADLVAVVRATLPYRNRLADFKQTPNPPKTPPPEVVKSALLNSTLWSLRLNTYQHKLVRDYLLYLQESPATPPLVKTELTAVLTWKPGKL